MLAKLHLHSLLLNDRQKIATACYDVPFQVIKFSANDKSLYRIYE
jgi:hypothetical protein